MAQTNISITLKTPSTLFQITVTLIIVLWRRIRFHTEIHEISSGRIWPGRIPQVLQLVVLCAPTLEDGPPVLLQVPWLLNESGTGNYLQTGIHGLSDPSNGGWPNFTVNECQNRDVNRRVSRETFCRLIGQPLKWVTNLLILFKLLLILVGTFGPTTLSDVD